MAPVPDVRAPGRRCMQATLSPGEARPALVFILRPRRATCCLSMSEIAVPFGIVDVLRGHGDALVEVAVAAPADLAPSAGHVPGAKRLGVALMDVERPRREVVHALLPRPRQPPLRAMCLAHLQHPFLCGVRAVPRERRRRLA